MLKLNRLIITNIYNEMGELRVPYTANGNMEQHSDLEKH